jgi:L-Ala-D/L-Glu epimerase
VRLKFCRKDWEFQSVFRISYQAQTHAETVVVEVEDRGLVGRGEAMGISYKGETADSILEQLSAVAKLGHEGFSRTELENVLPPGGARNALDCALWDLEAKQAGRRIWQLLGIDSVRPVVTDYTLGLDEPAAMGRAAAAARQYAMLKIKLNGVRDLERLELIRKARPDVQLMVDANQAWTLRHLGEIVPALVDLGVSLIEQPLPAGRDDGLDGFESPIPLCADESCQTSASLAGLLRKYDYINIKLDKTGGLTEALRLARLASNEGFRLMVGCMGGTSLAMAPAFVIAQLCEIADLDGPLLLRSDVPHSIRYEGSRMHAPEAALWG